MENSFIAGMALAENPETLAAVIDGLTAISQGREDVKMHGSTPPWSDDIFTGDESVNKWESATVQQDVVEGDCTIVPDEIIPLKMSTEGLKNETTIDPLQHSKQIFEAALQKLTPQQRNCLQQRGREGEKARLLLKKAISETSALPHATLTDGSFKNEMERTASAISRPTSWMDILETPTLAAARLEGEIDLVERIAGLITESGRDPANFLAMPHIVFSIENNYNSAAQRMMINRTFMLACQRHGDESREARYCMYNTGEHEKWLGVVKTVILPFLFRMNLV